MRYTIKQFKSEYPDDDVCLDAVFQNRYGDIQACPKCGVVNPKYYRVKKRKCYACKDCGNQLHPLADTIFHKSATPLTTWFFAIYLFSQAKNGVSAKELERHLGVTYKTAHRIGKQIRLLMQQNSDRLTGIVEGDETYIGGKGGRDWHDRKTAVMGLTERQGKAKAQVTQEPDATIAHQFITSNLTPEAELHTDESRIYSNVSRYRTHQTINHARKEYARDGVTTNTIEGFWSQLKRSLDGTYHCVSPKYLQSYVNEFVFRYNLRTVAVYPVLIERAWKPV